MAKTDNQLFRIIKIVLATLLILLGIIGGFLPILQGWIFVLAGIILFRSTQADDWRLPLWIDNRLPKNVKDIIYKDITLLKKQKKNRKK